MDRERATYDPDLPHVWMPESAGAHECAVCGGYSNDELHKVRLEHQRASAPLVTEKGS